MKKSLLTFAFFSLLFLLPNELVKAADVYIFDENHSSVTWSVNHFGFSNVSGKFSFVSGKILFDEAEPQKSSVEVEIKTSALSTGIEEFDKNLKKEQFFNVEKFPTAKFVSSEVIKVGRGAKIKGNLTLLNITKPVILSVKMNKSGINPLTRKKTIGFSANAIIKRSDFGINFGVPGISDIVKLEIEIEASLQSEKSAEENSKDSFKKSAEWALISQDSNITFTAIQDNSKISGSFAKFDGKITFDRNRLNNSKIDIEVDTTSIDMSFAEALEAVKSTRWLATRIFPKAVFRSERFVAINKGDFQDRLRVNGSLMIKNKTVPLSFDFVLDEYSKKSAIASGSFTIKRSDFGIGDKMEKRANGVKDEVLVNFKIVAAKSD